MAHGRLLAAATHGPDPVERLLGVVRLVLSVLTDVARRSNDALDTPVTILGQHFTTTREIAAHADHSRTRAYVQEVCSFDPDEGPKAHVGAQGQPRALMHLVITPTARAKAKRLGTQLEVKVSLSAPIPSRVLLYLEGDASGPPASSAGAEEYLFALPDLVLLDPLQPETRLTFKGALTVSCTTTELSVALTVAKDGSVAGTLERPLPQGGGAGKAQVLGSFSGCWSGRVTVSCPDVGLEGIVYDANPEAAVGGALASGGRGAIMRTVRLSKLGPVTLPRLWSALHDALFYISPDDAQGGRAAVQLAQRLPQHMRGLRLEGAATRDVAPAPIAGLPGGGAAAAEGGDTSDEEVAEFDRAMLANAAAAAEGAGDDARDAPPAYKALHVSGRRLQYQLQCSVRVVQGSLRQIMGRAAEAGAAAATAPAELAVHAARVPPRWGGGRPSQESRGQP